MSDGLRKQRRKHKPLEGGELNILGFGGSPPRRGLSQQDVVRKLVLWLESRRALSTMYELEGEWYANMSILDIRERFGETLNELDRHDEAFAIVRNWRQLCNAYVTAVPNPSQVSNGLSPRAAAALKSLRESFRVGLVRLADEYELPEARDLAHQIEAGTDW